MLKLRKWFGAGAKPEQFVLPEGPIDLASETALVDPYPLYAALRTTRPVAPLQVGGVLLTRHEDILAAMTNSVLGNAPSRFSALSVRNRDKHVAASIAAHIPPFLDMPEHKLPRQALSKAFYQVFRDQQKVLPELAQKCLNVLPSGEIELIKQYSSPFALTSMARFVGLSADLDQLKQLSEAFFHLFAPIRDSAGFAQTNQRLSEARAMIAASLERARHTPDNGLLSALLMFQTDHSDLSDQQIVDCALLVFADGIENIEAGAASVLRRLLQEDALNHPDLEQAVREALRLETPGQIVPRIAKEDTVLLGTPISAGTPVYLALASGNVDETVFELADQFEPDRSEGAITFGLGRHRCIGEQLGVAQLLAMLAALRDQGVRVCSPGIPLRYQDRFGHRWPAEMNVVIS